MCKSFERLFWNARFSSPVRATAMNTRLLSLVLTLFITFGAATRADANDWTVSGNASVQSDVQTLERLIGSSAVATDPPANDSATFRWSNVMLESEAGESVRANITLQLQFGDSYPVGRFTEYPGLVTVIESGVGTLSDLESGKTFTIRARHSGSQVASAIHSDSHGPKHLAIATSIELYDREHGLSVADGDLIATLDLSDINSPIANWAMLTSPSFAEIAADTRSHRSGLLTEVPIETYHASISNTNAFSAMDANQVTDLFSAESFKTYNCASEKFITLQLMSPGLVRSNTMFSQPFTLGLRYVPALIDDGRPTYLDSLIGEIVFHEDKTDRVVAIEAGNHGNFASQVVLSNESMQFLLAVAFRSEATLVPAVALMDISCRVDDGDMKCESMTISTARAPSGVSASPAALSTVFGTVMAQSGAAPSASDALKTAQRFGGDPETPCSDLCPACRPEGCNGGICTNVGAPLGCGVAGCTHYPNQPQCCRSTGKACCVIRCATPP